MRDICMKFRISEIEYHKLQSIADATGKPSIADTIRNMIERAFDREVLGLRSPFERPSSESN